MSCMIFLPSFHEHDDFIEGNEEFKLGGEDLEKRKKISKIYTLNSKNSYFPKILPLFLPKKS